MGMFPQSEEYDAKLNLYELALNKSEVDLIF